MKDRFLRFCEIYTMAFLVALGLWCGYMMLREICEDPIGIIFFLGLIPIIITTIRAHS